MQCPSCGASLNPETNERFIDCEYCHSKVGNFNAFEKIELLLLRDNSKFQDEYKKMAFLLKIKDYETLHNSSKQCLSLDPSDWLSLTYQSIALFWLGYDNFTHLGTVVLLLNKAEEFSERNEFVISAKDQIANDILIVACKNEPYGVDLENSIKAFSIALDIGKPSQDALMKMKEYCSNTCQKIIDQQNQLMRREKKNYEPTFSALKALYDMCILTNNITYKEHFYLHAKRLLAKSTGKSYSSELKMNIERIETELKEEKRSIVGKNIEIGVFGIGIK